MYIERTPHVKRGYTACKERSKVVSLLSMAMLMVSNRVHFRLLKDSKGPAAKRFGPIAPKGLESIKNRGAFSAGSIPVLYIGDHSSPG